MTVTEILTSTNTSDRSDRHVGYAHPGRRLAGLAAALATVAAIGLTNWPESSPPTAPPIPAPSGRPPAYLPGGSVYEQQVPSGPPAVDLPGRSVYKHVPTAR